MCVTLQSQMIPTHTFTYQSSFHGTPDYTIECPERINLFSAQVCLQVCRVAEMPGRGLEPLRISPPDPKSGASANSATPANCAAHDPRRVGCFGQIALERSLRF